MDTGRLMHLFVQHLPEYFKRKFSSKDNQFFASMTNLSHPKEDKFICDTDGYLLLMQTTQSNLSLFNISCDSLICNENDHVNSSRSRLAFNSSIKHSNTSFDLCYQNKKFEYRSTMAFSEEIFTANTNTLQRWQGLELLNTYS